MEQAKHKTLKIRLEEQMSLTLGAKHWKHWGSAKITKLVVKKSVRHVFTKMESKINDKEAIALNYKIKNRTRTFDSNSGDSLWQYLRIKKTFQKNEVSKLNTSYCLEQAEQRRYER